MSLQLIRRKESIKYETIQLYKKSSEMEDFLWNGNRIENIFDDSISRHAFTHSLV